MGLLPNFTDYRCTDDAVMVADLGFKKQLWALDEELDVVWDWASEKWEIWKFPGQAKAKKKLFDEKAVHVMTIQTRGRKFRELGADIFLNLQAGDTHKFSAKQLSDYFCQLDANIQRSKERAIRTRIESITNYNLDYLRGVTKIQVPQKFAIARAIGE